ncbi:MAG: ribosome biogenesis GTP-binding protein YihA/YsxC [Gammaproteobacteria bacterium]|nr:ribosome biogenesis GTP-binding protein YihA/YsxC [Gammaproteobacteria bacterium]
MTSAADMHRMPADGGREAAFIGRSNAGKSSALNRLANQRNLARTSATPGRTQLINFFALDDEANLRLVDLPGYGFARAPRAVQAKWAELVERYLGERASLRGVVLLADSRHDLKPGDRTLIGWAEASRLPLLILLTKADKLKRGPQNLALAAAQKNLPDNAEAMIFSARSGLGLDAARSWIATRLAK